jgi:hypothetical protein
MNTIASAYIGFAMSSVSSKVVHKRIGEGLIDDTGLVVSAQASTEIISSHVKRLSNYEAALFARMNRMIQFFLELLQVAGGDLNISKCACFTIFHRWQGGHATLIRTQESHPTMTITHPSTGEVKIITRKNPNEAHRALGWMMTTDGKSTDQFIVSKSKSKLFAGGIFQSLMQQYDATTAYNLYYLTSIGYTLTATCFSLAQCKTIQSPIICATLNKMGINRNVSHNFVFGPKHLGSMALRHLHTLQGIRRTQYLSGHLTNNDGVAKRMRICIEATQLEVGNFEPFFFLLYSLHGPPLISRSWIHEIWYFNELYNDTITISNSWLPHPQRTSYKDIMSLAVLFTSIKGELIQMNICRLFLQVTSISDICDTGGIRITQQAYNGTSVQKRTIISWPNQHRPSRGGWLIWRCFLRSFSDGNRYMFTPLGK